MEISEAWLLLGSYIHWDFTDQYPDLGSGILDVLKNFSPRQQEELCLFLKNLVTGDYTAAELSEIWDKSGAGFFVLGHEIKAFLSEIFSKACRS